MKDVPPRQPRVGDTYLRDRWDAPIDRLKQLFTGKARMWDVLCDNGMGTVGCDYRPLTRAERLDELRRCLALLPGKGWWE